MKPATPPRPVPLAEAAGSSSPPIAVRGLAVRYGRRTVLDGLSLEVAAGEVYALLGRNGAGKTSLLRCLLGQQKPALGAIRLFGLDAWRERTALMSRVAVVPERPDVPPDLPVGRAARFVAALRPAFDHQAFAARLERAGVDARDRFGSLSRGQQTLAQLALALSSRPELLVLDDPTLGLDVAARREVLREVVEALAEDEEARPNPPLAVLLTSHDLRGVEQVATRVGFLTGGRLALDLPLEELKARFRRLLLEHGGAVPSLPAGKVLRERQLAWAREWVVQLGAPAPGGMATDAAAFESLEMDLEEIFLALCEPEPARGEIPAEAVS